MVSCEIVVNIAWFDVVVNIVWFDIVVTIVRLALWPP